jgi:hypothetical protein
MIKLVEYEDAKLARNKIFILTKLDLLLVIDQGINTRCVGAVEVIQCSHTCSSSAACSCMVIHDVNPSRVVRPCALDAAPPRYSTHTGKKHRASRLLGP